MISIDFLGFISREVTDDRRWHRFQDTVTSRRDLFLIRRKTWSKWWAGSKQPVTPHSPTIPLAWLTPGCRFDYEPSSPLWLTAAFFLADIVPFFGVSFPSPSPVYPVPFACLTCQSRSGGLPHLIVCQGRLESELLCHVIFHYAFDSSRGSRGQRHLIGWQKWYNLCLTLGCIRLWVAY